MNWVARHEIGNKRIRSTLHTYEIKYLCSNGLKNNFPIHYKLSKIQFNV